jgi:hypothetical protein
MICSVLGFICKNLTIRMLSMNCLLLLGTVIPKKMVARTELEAKRTLRSQHPNLSRLFDTSSFRLFQAGKLFVNFVIVGCCWRMNAPPAPETTDAAFFEAASLRVLR